MTSFRRARGSTDVLLGDVLEGGPNDIGRSTAEVCDLLAFA